MWIVLSLLSAIFAATRRTTEKKLANTYHHFALGWLFQLCALPVITTIMLLSGQVLNPASLGPAFWLPLIVMSLGYYPLNTFLMLQAMKHDDLSNVLPIMSLWSVFSILPAWLILGEVPTLPAVVGIITIVAGVYALGLKGRALHRPWQPFVENKSSRYALLAVLLLTAVSVLDKVAIAASNAVFFSFASTVGAMLVLLGMAYISGVIKDSVQKPPLGVLATLGTLQGASYTTYLAAISLGPLAYVSAIRSSNTLIGSLLGILLLKEKFTNAKKLSFLLIAIGSVVLAIGS